MGGILGISSIFRILGLLIVLYIDKFIKLLVVINLDNW